MPSPIVAFDFAPDPLSATLLHWHRQIHLDCDVTQTVKHVG